MISFIYQKIRNKPFKEIFSLFFYPIILTYKMPFFWIKSLYNSRILLKGSLEKFMGFHPVNSLNNLFYHTQYLNLRRFNYNGVSSNIGLGNYDLGSWFHVHVLSNFIYSKAGALTTLLGVLILSFSNLLWLNNFDFYWVLTLTLMFFFSSTSYAMAFVRQNYQIIGLMFLPTIFFGIHNELYVFTSAIIFLVSFCGITTVFFLIPPFLFLSIYDQNYLLILVFLPAILKIFYTIFPLLFKSNTLKGFLELFKIIGGSKKVVYKRSGMKLDIDNLYFFLVYGIVFFGISFFNNQISWLILVGWIMLVVNQLLVRLADHETLIVFFISLLFFELVRTEPNVFLLIFFWIGVSLEPNRLSIIKNNKISDFTPFNHSVVEKIFFKFFEKIPEESRVVFAFSNPNGKYENIFDGLRHAIELPLNVAAKKNFHLMPDWYGVMETNYMDAPNIWGRSLLEVLKNLNIWNCKYAIIRINKGSEKIDDWLEKFDVLSSIESSEYESELNGFKIWNLSSPFQLVLIKLKK